VCSEDRKLLEEYGLVLERLQPSDLERWFDHLALVFDKTGRGYFVDHFNAEPDLDSILVIKSPIKNSILSTMRIFDQQIVVGDTLRRCAGVGEVSTKVEWRGKGLASILLRALESLMISKSFFIASLHTSSVSFYAKFGYKLVPMMFRTVTAQIMPTKATNLDISPISSITPEWIDLHHQACASRNFQGMLFRDEACWQTRIPQEVQRQCGRQQSLKTFSSAPLDPKLPLPPYSGFQFIDIADERKKAVCLSAQYPEIRNLVKIRELLVSDELLADLPLLEMVLSALIIASVDPSWTNFRIHCPEPIWNSVFAKLLVSSKMEIGGIQCIGVEVDTSDGIMYKHLGGDESALEHFSNQAHLFLSLDAF
jgi:GNAT superfamily N-acetyltransferase